MASVLLTFEIDASKNCPAYKAGMQFVLRDSLLRISGSHEICLVLARKVTEILMTQMASISEGKGDSGRKTYTCGGCSGLIKFSQRPNSGQKVKDPNVLVSEKKDLLELLSLCDPLEGVDKSSLVELLGCASQHKLAPNTILVKKGAKSKYVFIVVSGTAEVLEQKTKIAEIYKGQLFGEMSLFSDKAASATVAAKTDLEVLVIPASDFKVFMRIHESVQDYLIRQLVKKLEESNRHRVQDYSSGMRGRLSDIGPAELFQTFNMHQLTGTLNLQINNTPARVAFRDGAIVSAKFRNLSAKEALYAVFRQTEGTFLFNSELHPEDQEAEALGDFMLLLMEGSKQSDELNSLGSGGYN